MTIGSFIRDNRIKQGLTQKDISDYLGLSTYQHISNIERDLVTPSLKTIDKLSKILKIDSENLENMIINEKVMMIKRRSKR